jgi:hypothetical protein
MRRCSHHIAVVAFTVSANFSAIPVFADEHPSGLLTPDILNTQESIQATCEPVMQYVTHGISGQKLGQNLGPCMVSVVNEMHEEWSKTDVLFSESSTLYEQAPYYYGVAQGLVSSRCNVPHEELKTIAGEIDDSSESILRFGYSFGNYIDSCVDTMRTIRGLAGKYSISTNINVTNLDLIHVFSFGVRGAMDEIGFDDAGKYKKAFIDYLEEQNSPTSQNLPTLRR